MQRKKKAENILHNIYMYSGDMGDLRIMVLEWEMFYIPHHASSV